MSELPENVRANIVEPENRAQWREWLATNHSRPNGVWVVLNKKSAPTPNLSLDDAGQEALCFGWVDSSIRRLDEHRSLLYLSPRKRGSGWSAVNKARIARLQAEGLMGAPGQSVIDAAVADGSWCLLDDVEALVVPVDLQAAFAGRLGAAEHWESLSRSVRRAALEWIVQARTAPTRARRVESTADSCGAGRRPGPG
jgi:uncharacterized protein YdeI (YjbR/CyaY-like superfamily)